MQHITNHDCAKGRTYAKIANKKKREKKKKIPQRLDWVVFLKSCHGAQNSTMDLRMKFWQMGSTEPGITAISDEAAPHCIRASQKWQQRSWGCWWMAMFSLLYILLFSPPTGRGRCKSGSLHMVFWRLRKNWRCSCCLQGKIVTTAWLMSLRRGGCLELKKNVVLFYLFIFKHVNYIHFNDLCISNVLIGAMD